MTAVARHSRNEEWRREEYIVDVAHLGLATVSAQKAPKPSGLGLGLGLANPRLGLATVAAQKAPEVRLWVRVRVRLRLRLRVSEPPP